MKKIIKNIKLDGTKWDRRKIDDISKESMEKKILDIGFKVVDKI